MNLKNKKILLTGKNGFLGAHVYNSLLESGIHKSNIRSTSSSQQNLVIFENCKRATKGVDVVIHLAAKIGGIGFNKEKPGEIIYENVVMGMHLMEAARQNNVKKFVTVGTVCSYPKNAPIPFKEKDMWDGYPEEVTAPYGIAKKTLWVQGKAYKDQYKFKSIFLLPVNLYGPNDHFESKYSHVMPALIKKVVDAKTKNSPSVTVWGTGKATREFLYVKDAAKAIVLATKKYDKIDPVNLGTSHEVSIKDLVEMISEVVGYTGSIRWDTTKPDGVLRRKVSTARAKREFGFVASTRLKTGVEETVDWYIKQIKR